MMKREKLAFRYTSALERGDFATVVQVLRHAESDALLAQMLYEIDIAYVGEGAQAVRRIEREDTMIAANTNGYVSGHKTSGTVVNGVEAGGFSGSPRANLRVRRRRHAPRLAALLVLCLAVTIALAVSFVPRPMESASLVQIENSLLPATLERITADNIDRLEVVATLGEGVLYDGAWSPDGTTIAAAGARGVWLMDAVDPTQRALLTAGDTGITSVAYSPDGATIAAGDFEGNIHLYHAATRRRTDTIAAPHMTQATPMPAQHYRVLQVAWIDNARLAAMFVEGPVVTTTLPRPMLWLYDKSAQTWEALESTNMLISSNFAVSGSFMHIAYLRRVADGAQLMLLDLRSGDRELLATYTNSVQALTFSRGGETLYVAHESGIDRWFWEVVPGEQRQTWLLNEGTYESARYLAISPDNRYLTLADTRGGIIIFNLESGERARLDTGTYGAFPVALDFSTDGTEYFYMTSDGLHFNSVAGDAPRRYVTNQTGIAALSLDEAGETLAALEWGDAQPRLWDLVMGEDRQLTVERPPDDFYYSASTADLSADGTRLLTTTGRYVTLIDTVTEGVIWQEQVTDGMGAGFARGDADVMVFDRGENEVRVLGSEPSSQEERIVFDDSLQAGAWTEAHLAVGVYGTCGSGQSRSCVMVWDYAPNYMRNTLLLDEVEVNALAFNADGSLLALAMSDLGERPTSQTRRVILWDWERGEVITLEDSLHESIGDISQLAVSEDGALVYALSNVNGVLRVWDTESLAKVATLDGAETGWALTTLALSRDERLLITGGYDGLVRVWGVRG